MCTTCPMASRVRAEPPMRCHGHQTSEWNFCQTVVSTAACVQSHVRLQEHTGWEAVMETCSMHVHPSYITFLTRSNLAAPHYTLRTTPPQAGGCQCCQGRCVHYANEEAGSGPIFR